MCTSVPERFDSRSTGVLRTAHGARTLRHNHCCRADKLGHNPSASGLGGLNRSKRGYIVNCPGWRKHDECILAASEFLNCYDFPKMTTRRAK